MELEKTSLNERYSRHIKLNEIGYAGQQKITASKILVIGAGGLGCPLLQYLVAAGVGTIGIVDNDVVSLSNLQRQVLFSTSEIGKLKVNVAASRLSELNPEVSIIPYPVKFQSDNALDLLEGYDILIDGSDNFNTKYLANDAAVLSGKPLVMASIFKFEGQLSVFNYKGGPTYRCLFPDRGDPELTPACNSVGVLGVLPGMMGVLMANEVLKMILELGDILCGKLLKIDLLTMKQQVFTFHKDPSIEITALVSENSLCSLNREIDLKTFQMRPEEFFLLDVRETEERKVKSIGGYHIPLTELSVRYEELKPFDNILVYCASGKRSEQAIQWLSDKYRNKVFFNLTRGIEGN
ncbi:ThiF family adenylyltransferase [Robertkochia solimangrovi]|uniref:ThiF family adenylyltransferase n=1 Tax=Robertkochia solimangrovi TaxID=2213046 RepID=UPI00117F4327|nr:ThiF family adenylyltransferase [Robertkochia solimangrovi]TRZ41307.1 dinucleotide-utilizing protein [Robertkochia solimangrovi]